jgi:hypothetical protein
MPVGESDTPAVAFPAARPLHENCRRPMNIVERKARIHERLLPGWSSAGVFPVALDLLNGGGEICLGTDELDTAVVALIPRQALLQRFLDRPLQRRVDRGMHRVGCIGDPIDAGFRPRLAGDLIDEVESGVAAWPVEGHHRRQRRQSRSGFLLVLPGVEQAVFPHAV